MNVSDDIKAVLVNNGVDIDGGSFHSWRCFDKERYPEPCTCTDEVVAEVMVVVDAAVAAAEQRVRDEFMDSTPELTAYRKQQYAAGVKAARDAVTAVQAERGYDAAINWSEIGNEYAEGWTDLLSLILPAIDAIIDGSRNTG